MRSTLTATSRPMMSMATQTAMRPWLTRAMSAAAMSSLSASGSRNCPSVVICLLRRAT